MIPAFNGTNALPVGRYQCTLSEAKKALVDDLIPNSPVRDEIWNGFLAAVKIMKSLQCAIPSVFVGGTFATTKPDPSDIDITFLIDRESTAQPFSMQSIENALEVIRVETHGKVDCYAIPWVPINNLIITVGEEEYIRNRGMWDDWWQRDVPKAHRTVFDRTQSFPKRGYLEVIIDGYQ